MESSFAVEKISKSFGTKSVLKDISLEIKPGEIVGLIGKSGCGDYLISKEKV